jgi:hypothetical protein
MSHQENFIKCICVAIEYSPLQMQQYLVLLMEKAVNPFENAFEINIIMGILIELARLNGEETTRIIDNISDTQKKIYKSATRSDLKNFYFKGLMQY